MTSRDPGCFSVVLFDFTSNQLLLRAILLPKLFGDGWKLYLE